MAFWNKKAATKADAPALAPQSAPARKSGAKSSSNAWRWSILIGVSVHVGLLAAAGIIVISHTFFNREQTFTGQPPPMKTYEPRKLEHRVKVQKQQRSSSRPSMAPRLVANKVTQGLSLPDIKVDAKVAKTSFQPSFKAVSGSGIGVGLGTGYGLGGFGLGVSQFNFFGIRGKGERIAILVDVSVSMVEEQKGGERGYLSVKTRIQKVIDALNEGTVFNCIVFADAASQFEKEMVVATKDNKTRAKAWLLPYNSHGNYGLTTGNAPNSDRGLPAGGGTTRLDLAITAAFLQGADTILIISDGLPEIEKVITEEQISAHNAVVQKWSADNAGRIAQYQQQAAAVAPAQQVEGVSSKVWVPATPARPPRKSMKEGVHDDPGAPEIPAHWQIVVNHPVAHAGRGPMPQPPALAPPGKWTLSDFIEHIKRLYDALYVKQGRKLPVIHTIGYSIDDAGSEFLKGLTLHYKGQYRRVAKLTD